MSLSCLKHLTTLVMDSMRRTLVFGAEAFVNKGRSMSNLTLNEVAFAAEPGFKFQCLK